MYINQVFSKTYSDTPKQESNVSSEYVKNAIANRNDRVESKEIDKSFLSASEYNELILNGKSEEIRIQARIDEMLIEQKKLLTSIRLEEKNKKANKAAKITANCMTSKGVDLASIKAAKKANRKRKGKVTKYANATSQRDVSKSIRANQTKKFNYKN